MMPDESTKPRDSFKFAGVQMMATNDKKRNLTVASQMIDEAAKSGAFVIALPEFFNMFDDFGGRASFAEKDDGESATMLSQAAQRNKCSMVVYPAAFDNQTGRPIWELIIKSRAVDNQCYVAGINSAQSDHVYGHSAISGPFGEIVSKTDGSESIVYADIELEKIKEVYRQCPVPHQRKLTCEISLP
eukprot:gene11578-13513_t